MKASDIAKAISVMDQAYELILSQVPPGTEGKVRIASALKFSAIELNAQLATTIVSVE